MKRAIYPLGLVSAIFLNGCGDSNVQSDSNIYVARVIDPPTFEEINLRNKTAPVSVEVEGTRYELFVKDERDPSGELKVDYRIEDSVGLLLRGRKLHITKKNLIEGVIYIDSIDFAGPNR